MPATGRPVTHIERDEPLSDQDRELIASALATQVGLVRVARHGEHVTVTRYCWVTVYTAVVVTAILVILIYGAAVN